MTTPAIQHLTIDNVDIAYVRTGATSPSPLAILHGLGDSAIITFHRIATHPALASIPALLIDLPGFGHSMAPSGWISTTEAQAQIVISLLDALGVIGAPIMGHSMGGSIAILTAHRRPDLVSSLIVAEPLLEPAQSELGKTIAKRTEEFFIARGFDMLKLATRRQSLRGDKAALGFQEALSRANPAIMYRSAVSLLQERSPSFGGMLEALAIPRTMLVGTTTHLDTEDLAAHGVVIVEIPDAGHSMMSENPDAFARAIADALTIQESPGSG